MHSIQFFCNTSFNFYSNCTHTVPIVQSWDYSSPVTYVQGRGIPFYVQPQGLPAVSSPSPSSSFGLLICIIYKRQKAGFSCPTADPNFPSFVCFLFQQLIYISGVAIIVTRNSGFPAVYRVLLPVRLMKEKFPGKSAVRSSKESGRS